MFAQSRSRPVIDPSYTRETGARSERLARPERQEPTGSSQRVGVEGPREVEAQERVLARARQPEPQADADVGETPPAVGIAPGDSGVPEDRRPERDELEHVVEEEEPELDVCD